MGDNVADIIAALSLIGLATSIMGLISSAVQILGIVDPGVMVTMITDIVVYLFLHTPTISSVTAGLIVLYYEYNRSARVNGYIAKAKMILNQSKLADLGKRTSNKKTM